MAVPYKSINRDYSFSEQQWRSNSNPPPGVPSGAMFNPYVAATVVTPSNTTQGGTIGIVQVRSSLQDQNGNTTSTSEYDWAPAAAVTRDANGLITSPCSGCNLLRSGTANFNGSGTPYWQHGGAAYLRAPISSQTGTLTTSYTFDSPTTANLLMLSQTDTASGGTTATTHSTYLTNGNVASSTDANNTVTSISYAATNNCTAAYANLYPCSVTVAGQTTSYAYDYSSGTLSSTTDPNNITTTYTYDLLGRATQVEQKTQSASLDRKTSVTYDDLNLTVTTQQDDQGGNRLTTVTTLDALGRPISTVDNLNRKVEKAYRYGSGGVSYELASNPHTNTANPNTDGWTLTTRTWNSTPGPQPDTVVVTTYDSPALPGPWGTGAQPNQTGQVKSTANVIVPNNVPGCAGIATTVTDPANNVRTNCVDGLGRLSAVIEPNGVVTQYGYDVFNNLLSVSTPSTGLTRNFTYSLSRLHTATNPESNTVSYTYDGNGNVLTRTDFNSTVTTYTYDSLNRPTSATYNLGANVASTPSVTYSYDTSTLGTGFVGALTSVSSSNGKMEFAYDGFGRISSSRQTTPLNGTPYNFTNYSYTLSDQLTSMTYPSGRIVTYTLDTADQVTGVSGAPAGGTATSYATGIQYTAAGDLSSLPFGNGVTEGHTWNNRLQHTGITAGNLLGLSYSYCSNGASYCSTGNTGSPFQQSISVGGQTMATQVFQHDSLNRLTGASEYPGATPGTGACPDNTASWMVKFTYDNGGNRSLPCQWPSPPSFSALQPQAFNPSTNRITDTGWGYDANGNVNKTPAPQTMAYDGENRQVAFCSSTSSACPVQPALNQTVYVYDGLGNRVQQLGYSNGAATTTTYVYDAFGNLAAEYGGGAVPSGTQYVTVDALGSTRLLMSGGGAMERHDFQPFGVELKSSTNTSTDSWRASVTGFGYASDTLRQKFTGQERDGDSGLDFFQARYFGAPGGRFFSPDPGNAGASLTDPQSWNGYGYVSNNPLTYTDPSGMFLSATAVGASAGGPIGAGIGAAVDIGLLLFGRFGGGGGQPDLSGVASTPNPLGGVPGSPQVPGSNGLLPCGQTMKGCPPSPLWSTAGYFVNWVTGTGPRLRYYGPKDFRTLDFMKSMGFQTTMLKIAGACRDGAISGKVSLGTYEGGYNLPYDIPNSPVGAEVGGYDGGRWRANGSDIDIKIHNDSGTRSFFYGKVPNSPLPFGPMRTIHQTFEIKVPNPCSTK